MFIHIYIYIYIHIYIYICIGLGPRLPDPVPLRAGDQKQTIK